LQSSNPPALEYDEESRRPPAAGAAKAAVSTAPTARFAAFAEAARESGFELFGVAPALPLEAFSFYGDWAEAGMAGPMGYLTDHRAALRHDPRLLLPSARSVLCLGKLYKTKDVSPAPGRGRISSYAWGTADYHDLVRRGLERLAALLTARWGEFEYRILVDTAPLLERAYARAAGLGWIGKNTCLINEPAGSWFFLGEILVSVEIPPATPPPERCGTCRRCIDACPTAALLPGPGAPGPDWQLDARLCISTLTIEQRGPIDENLRPLMADHLFGCDICQDVCPWNHRAPHSLEPGLQPANAAPALDDLAAMTREDFRTRFRQTPIWRAKYQGLLRNVAVAMGNSHNPAHRPGLERLAQNGDPNVEEHARWALRQLEEQP
jgi:epoxyqueuosine reductase